MIPTPTDFLKQTETIRPEKFSEFADAHRQNSSRGSGPGGHHCCASARCRMRSCKCAQPFFAFLYSSSTRPNDCCRNVMMVTPPDSFSRYCRFVITGLDINSGPQISSSVGFLIACTVPQ